MGVGRWVLLCTVLTGLDPVRVQGQSYEAYREVWQGKKRARFETFDIDALSQYNTYTDRQRTGYVSDRPAEFSRYLGDTENRLVDPFNWPDANASAKHVLVMIHGYGPLAGEYIDREEDFFVQDVSGTFGKLHMTGTDFWFWDEPTGTGVALYPYLRRTEPAFGFDPSEWVILGVTMDIKPLSGLSVLENKQRLIALMDLLWAHYREKIRSIAFVSHSTGGLITKAALGEVNPTAHEWIRYVDDHISLAGAHGGTPFVTIEPGALALKHQLAYGIQDEADFDQEGGYYYTASQTVDHDTKKRSLRWPAHINVLVVAGVWPEETDDYRFDGNPWTGRKEGVIRADVNSLVNVFNVAILEGKTDGVVPSLSVIEHIQYKSLFPFSEWRYQIAEADRYDIDFDGNWKLPSLGQIGDLLEYASGSGSLPAGAPSNADNIPARDRYPGEKITYVEVNAEHNGMGHNEHVMRAIKRRLGTVTVKPNVEVSVVAGLEPRRGSAAGGEVVTIRGTGFRYVKAVFFGTVASPQFEVISEEEIRAVAPPGDGLVNVFVHNTMGPSQSVALANNYQYLTPLPKPQIEPAGGTFSTPVQVALHVDALDADLYYTLDGSEPSPANPRARVYTQPFLVGADFTGASDTFTLKVRAWGETFLPSETATATFRITAVVAAPSFLPNGGDFTGMVNVSLATSTPGASIFYTTNGQEPDFNATFYTGPFQLGVGAHTVKAIAYRIGYAPSPVVTATFRVYDGSTERVADPIFDPFSSGDFADSVRVTLFSWTQGATIRYTLAKDQAPPDPDEQAMHYTGPLQLGLGNWFIRAKAFKEGMPASNVVQRNYRVSKALGKTNDLVITPRNGTFYNDVTITIEASTTPATTGVQIFYTTDGTRPVADPQRPGNYTGPFLLRKSATIHAIATRRFFTPSGIGKARIHLQCAPPTFELPGGTYYDSVRVVLISETNGAVLHYTLDGSLPSDSSQRYTGPFTLYQNTTVMVRGFKPGYTPSEVAAATYVVQPSKAPIFLRQPGHQTRIAGDTLVLVARAEGDPTPELRWWHNGQELEGQAGDTLRIFPVKVSHGGFYQAQARNVAAAIWSDTAWVQILPAEVAPEITSQPVDVVAYQGQAVSFSVQVQARPVPAYQWYHNGEPLSGATRPVLLLSGIDSSHAGGYYVKLDNGVGTATSREAVLTVKPAVAPLILQDPIDLEVMEGDTAWFQVEAIGQPMPAYQWLRDEQPIFGAAGPFFMIPAVAWEHAGEYRMVVSNLAGVDTSRSARLQVKRSTGVRRYVMGELPDQVMLHASYPNPFWKQVTIRFDLPQRTRLRLAVYDLLGRMVRVLVEGAIDAGYHEVSWDGRAQNGAPLAGGLYFYRLETDTVVQTRKMTRLQ